jgi:O-antigen/teichoic acid export membrane protein
MIFRNIKNFELVNLKKYNGMAFAFGDQIIYSASSFLTGILIGRLLSIGDFGEFSLGLSLLIFSIIFQDTLLATPYTLRIHKEAQNTHAGLRAGAVLQSFLLSSFCSALLLTASLFLPSTFTGMKPILLSLSISVPFIFLRECLRRQLFAEFKMVSAFKLDTCVSILQFLFIFLLWKYDALSASSAFAAIAGACFIGAILVFLSHRKDYDFRSMTVAHDTMENLRFGRWLLAGSFCHLGSLYAYPWFIFFSHGKIEAGAYAACFNIISLLNPFILGFNNYFRPKIAQVYARDGIAAMHALIKKTLFFLAPVALTIIIVTFVGGDWIIHLLYGSEFLGLGPVIALLSLSVLPTVLNAPMQLGVLAMNRPQINPTFHAFALTTTLCVGIPLVMMFAKMGAAGGYTLTALVGCSVLYILYKREVKRLR